jgi:hypothetical protein
VWSGNHKKSRPPRPVAGGRAAGFYRLVIDQATFAHCCTAVLSSRRPHQLDRTRPGIEQGVVCHHFLIIFLKTARHDGNKNNVREHGSKKKKKRILPRAI